MQKVTIYNAKSLTYIWVKRNKYFAKSNKYNAKSNKYNAKK